MEAADNVKPWVKDIPAYVPGETREGFIKLASNENNWGPSPKVVEALIRKATKVYKYPYKGELVREKTAQYCGASKENIVLGNGSDELIDLVVKTFRGPSLGVTPSFAEYKVVSKTNGMEYLEVRANTDFSFPKDEFMKASEKANLIFLCNPNNPLGNTVSSETIKEILDLGKITVVDEAYFEFSGTTAFPLLNTYDNLIILRTYAKAFALAGLRVGYAIADRKIISLISKTKPPFNVNSLAQEACLAALDDIQYMRDCVEKIIKDRETMAQNLSVKYKVFPSCANFVLVDVSPMKAEDFFEKLLKEKIIVRCFKKFPGFTGEFVRITVGTSGENEKLYAALDTL